AAEAPRSPAPDQARIEQRIPAPHEYTIARWQIEDGLPQITVKEILQTRDGFLWLGTYNGLARFDGVRFTVFGLNNTRELVSDDVNAFYEDKGGRLWIATSEAGVVRYWAG